MGNVAYLNVIILTVVKHIKWHEALPADKAFYTNQWWLASRMLIGRKHKRYKKRFVQLLTTSKAWTNWPCLATKGGCNMLACLTETSFDFIFYIAYTKSENYLNHILIFHIVIYSKNTSNCLIDWLIDLLPNLYRSDQDPVFQKVAE